MRYWFNCCFGKINGLSWKKGWHWFRYQDNDPTAKGVDPSNLDSNKGLVDNEYNLYKPLGDAMKELNINAYRLADWFDQQSTNNK